ncbi:MAG: hypothetical protein KDD82_17265 [Planctomycetes bacterium]|nr:hypothetical protein [Planctomycetota bacterium]
MFGTKSYALLFGLATLATVGLAKHEGSAAAPAVEATQAEASGESFSSPQLVVDAELVGPDAPAQLEAPAWPQRSYVRGEDLAALLTVEEDGRATLSGRTFGGKQASGEAFAFTGERRADGSLALSAPAPAPHKGLRWFLDGLDGERATPEPLTATLTPGADGAFCGTLLGREVSSAPAPDTSDLVALVVPGLSTNLWNQYGIPYLDENLGVFAARGIEARRVAINTEVGVDENAATIAAALREVVAQGKRVLLFAHSKGGADTVTALTDPANADLLPQVAGFVAIQPVFSGARISDGIDSGELIAFVTKVRHEKLAKVAEKAVRSATNAAFEHLLPLLNREDDHGSRLAWSDLRSADRQAALAARPFPADRIPTVTVRSSFSGRRLLRMELPDGERKFRLGKNALRTPLVVFQRFVEGHYGEANDGMVSLSAQAIPGAAADVVYENLDHFEPGVRGESPVTPSRLTQDALDEVLPRLKAPAVER